ncbi:WecB/TagA/CpsF family glycosyltransferase [Serinicoccus chungangensis]|uniref:WecB/TagA/CpsF family glycosyltransferase n=1 Tax=Serinicoccus chungangensis TaxID=767452 RepID=UPI0009F99F56
MDAASLVYADGIAIVLLARIGGARVIERAPTTDIGISILREMAKTLERPVRVALIGGPPGLADSAASVLQEKSPAHTVFTSHGYFSDDLEMLDSLREARPDVIFLGLGMPLEAVWSVQNRSELPPSIVVTCGGWFGFLAGEERRAPLVLQRLGLEWVYRLKQDFPRLAGRYSRGLLMSISLIPSQLRVRRYTRGRSLFSSLTTRRNATLRG